MRACFCGPGPSRPFSCCSLAAVAAVPAVAQVATARPPIVVQSSIRGIALGMTPDRGPRRARRADGVRGHARTRSSGRCASGATRACGSCSTATGGAARCCPSRRRAAATGRPPASGSAHARRTSSASCAGVRCATRYGYRSCTVGGGKAGQITTDFSISGTGKVTPRDALPRRRLTGVWRLRAPRRAINPGRMTTRTRPAILLLLVAAAAAFGVAGCGGTEQSQADKAAAARRRAGEEPAEDRGRQAEDDHGQGRQGHPGAG